MNYAVEITTDEQLLGPIPLPECKQPIARGEVLMMGLNAYHIVAIVHDLNAKNSYCVLRRLEADNLTDALKQSERENL